MAAMFENYHWLKVPSIFWDISSKRVLVMEYVTGGQVNDLEYIESNKIDRYDVANKIGQLYSNMIFINGFVHSDPHPGNILVRKTTKGDTEIVLLDHGLYAVSGEFDEWLLVPVKIFTINFSLYHWTESYGQIPVHILEAMAEHFECGP